LSRVADAAIDQQCLYTLVLISNASSTTLTLLSKAWPELCPVLLPVEIVLSYFFTAVKFYTSGHLPDINSHLLANE
jgi:hypothetical protein